MATPVKVLVPDIGGFKDVSVVDVLVKDGQQIDKETPLITLETEKAAMDVPAPAAGRIARDQVKQGDKVSEGSLILAPRGCGHGDRLLLLPRNRLRAAASAAAAAPAATRSRRPRPLRLPAPERRAATPAKDAPAARDSAARDSAAPSGAGPHRMRRYRRAECRSGSPRRARRDR